ncbi:hypothetical protein SAMN05216466_106190 [Paraburkholderia phenazinium]|uniref:Uncharacterized protein n=1 Tax=Paraburkholderia phenazinium TaxID=60549 RepID=A0A1G7YHR5_9BURK|nr:hypothetical protein [Paraburkholderia phenazinium]SDG95947.1 hypothetical protein SAMN05216466_106190 [Paraburkholderia phenazinium]
MQQPNAHRSAGDHQNAEPQRERIVADVLSAKFDAYDVTRLMVACSEPIPLGCLLMVGVPMEERFVIVGAKGPADEQQVRDDTTAADLWTLVQIMVVLGEREERGLAMNAPVGETFSLLEISALCAFQHEVKEPGINAFHRAAKLDGARINDRYQAAMLDLPEIEKRALIAMGKAWEDLDDLDEIGRQVRLSLKHSPIAEAIAKRRATGAGGITFH